MRPTGAAAVVAVLVVLFLPVLYVLSIGPAVYLHDRGMLSPSAIGTLEKIYSPLEWAASRSSAIEYPINWYVALWAAPSTPMPAPPATAAPVMAVAPVQSPAAAPAYASPPAATSIAPAEAETIAP